VHANRFLAAGALAAVLVLTVTQTVGAAQHVKYQGTGSLMPTWGADLDTAVFNDPSPGSMSNDDLYFYVQGTHRYLDGFQSWGFGRMASRPSYQTCKNAVLSDSSRYAVAKNVGRWFCVETSERRFARVRIDSAVVGHNLYLTYLVWCKTNSNC
jgi:hypothetical protein